MLTTRSFASSPLQGVQSHWIQLELRLSYGWYDALLRLMVFDIVYAAVKELMSDLIANLLWMLIDMALVALTVICGGVSLSGIVLIC